MKQTVNFSDFCDTFRNMGRDENFTYAGKRALFDYLEGMDEDTGTDTELDVIGLCCDFSEFADLAEFQEAYSIDYVTIKDIERETLVLDVADGDGFIIQNF